MLTRYRLTVQVPADSRPGPAWGYRLYAALLEQTPPEFGEAVHRDAVTPVSQFFARSGDDWVWTVSLLGEGCGQLLGPLLAQTRTISLRQCPVAVTRTAQAAVDDVETLLTRAAGHSGLHTLHFETATAFKSQGRYVNLPTPWLVVQSLVKKWNGCFPDCPIEDTDGQGVAALAAGLRFTGFRLRDQRYVLKGSAIPGFVGTVTLENDLHGFHRQLADALLLFAAYAGVGIKTTLGMGGVTVRPGP
jgi:CRISPR-associated endoribonuclease Cas6